jgi:dTDP-4-amino-4,6-dideoxygalactose transaminase
MTHNPWPLGQIPQHLQRPELAQLKESGYSWNDPLEVVDQFEKKVAKFAGSKHAVAVDCCSHGLFLCLKYLDASGNITIPKNTYVSVPMQIKHAGCNPVFEDLEWSGKYQLQPYPIWDAATQWKQNMYIEGLHVISFQIKKHIPIGRGGMILTNDIDAYQWLKKACHDGRDMTVPYNHDNFEMLGWHYYMTPEDAARGMLLMDAVDSSFDDIWNNTSYIDLSTKTIFKEK